MNVLCDIGLTQVEDATLAKPWWEEKIEEWLERAGCCDGVQVVGASDNGHLQGPRREKLARGPKPIRPLEREIKCPHSTL